MKVGDLIYNTEFSFNCDYRVVTYAPTKKDPDHVDVLLDSRAEKNETTPNEIYFMNISAINQNDDGSIDIECYDNYIRGGKG